MNYWQQFQSSSDCSIYSLDMVRLSVDFRNELDGFEAWVKHLAEFDAKYDVKCHQSFDWFKFRKVFTFTVQGCSWCVGVGWQKYASKGFIEFNPNKCFSSPTFQSWWECFKLKTPRRELKRYDLAIDIPCDRSNAWLFRRGKKNYQVVESDDGYTEYLGQRSHSGFIKLYDKTREARLPYPLTRLEMTLDAEVDPASEFPTVFLFDAQLSLATPDFEALLTPDRVMLQLFRECPLPRRRYYWGQLDSRKRKKLEPYLADKALTLDSRLANEVKQLARSLEQR